MSPQKRGPKKILDMYNFLENGWVWGISLYETLWDHLGKREKLDLRSTKINRYLSVWPDMAIFGGVWRQFFCPKSPVYKSFDVDILGFGKFTFVLWRQIWRFLPKSWLLFGLNTWSHWYLFNLAFGNPFSASRLSLAQQKFLLACSSFGCATQCSTRNQVCCCWR